jgi:membrane-associated protease RseP (regulator of RpoE activity)
MLERMATSVTTRAAAADRQRSRSRARWGGPVALAALLLAGASWPLAAQQRTVLLRSQESPFEAEVDRLVQELLQKRQMAVAFVSNLQQLQGALRTSSLTEEQRNSVEGSLRLLRTRLTSLETDRARIRARLNQICDADRQPDGWVGIAYSSSASATREDDGRVILRFIDYPSIESVEPGSPADKAGIRGGDRLIAMAGRDLRDAEIDMSPMLKPGSRIAFKVQRGVETKQFDVMIEPRPSDFTTPCPWVDERIAAAFAPSQLVVTVTTEGDPSGVVAGGQGQTRVFARQRTPAPPASDAPAPPSVVVAVPPVPPMPPLPPVGVGGNGASVVFGGAQFISVSPELAEALGVERGLMVVGVGRGSPAEQSGIRTGDVLVSVDGRALVSPLVFLQAVEQSSRRELQLQLVRTRNGVATTLRW